MTKPGPLERLANSFTQKPDFKETYRSNEWVTVDDAARYYDATAAAVIELAKENGLLVDQDGKAYVENAEFHKVALARGWAQ